MQERAHAKPIFEERKGERAGTGEENEAREPDLERVHVIPVDVGGPAEEEVVHHREREAGRNTDCARVSNDGLEAVAHTHSSRTCRPSSRSQNGPERSTRGRCGAARC
jgi:hypothetical protein